MTMAMVEVEITEVTAEDTAAEEVTPITATTLAVDIKRITCPSCPSSH
jgi:hypothetical protein